MTFKTVAFNLCQINVTKSPSDKTVCNLKIPMCTYKKTTLNNLTILFAIFYQITISYTVYTHY